MKKVILVLLALTTLVGCTKISQDLGLRNELAPEPKSKWVCTIEGQGYCMEFTSRKDVKLYACDSNYQEVSHDTYADDEARVMYDTYEMLGPIIEFGGKMYLGGANTQKWYIKSAYYLIGGNANWITDRFVVIMSSPLNEHTKELVFSRI